MTLADPAEAGLDPRARMSAQDLAAANLRAAPTVGRPGRLGEALGLFAGAAVALGLGGVTLLSMGHARRSAPRPAPLAAAVPPLAPAPPPPRAAQASSVSAPPAIVSQAAAAPVVAAPASTPLLVLDQAPLLTVARAGPAPGVSPAAPKSAVYFTPDEQFAARAGDEQPPVSHATRLAHPDQTIAQGAIIPAVLETALNSDLPGYARALVSQEVRSFDGARVLIPRGARLIGQYKSGLQVGQSRAFIVWTRLLRPDGVSVQLGSPVMDEAGQTGLSGKVDRHFAQRFGSAVLLSVVGGLASAAGGSSTVVIGTASEGSSAASTALQSDAKIAPTVRVPQGTPIQVFAARDLDFTE